MFDLEKYRNPSLAEALVITSIIFSLLGFFMIFIPNTIPHIPVLFSIVFLLLYGMIRKVSFTKLQESMTNSVTTSMGAIYLFFFIGILVSVLMMSGAIPTLMYYGLDIISEKMFYLSAFLITAIIGISIGSSLTTVASLGVALMGISNAFLLNPAITAGAIVSGAFFGDKMSPLSDTTGISATIVGVDLFEHIKNMMYTTIPAFIISAAVFTVLSPLNNVGDISAILKFKEDILKTGLVHYYSLIPFILLILFSIMKVQAIPSIIYTSITGIIISLTHTSYSLENISSFLFSGFYMENIPDSISSLITRGGINSMFFTLTIVILALSLGGLLFGLGVIPTLLDSMAHLLTNSKRATICVVLTALGINFIVGEQYLSILLTGKTFKPVYDKLNLHSKNLSRTLEDSGTVINPLVPWGVCGVFISSMLGVPTISYVPFSIFCYASLILTILFGFTGLTITKSK
ncbi:Na+/H+ antiporter NhaC [Oceanivirga miroungae]|uniref:Na(+)/H(+) antiporter NhaC n=1 Tax=Oceanivirga miroungae TaxID=1130046 RepID=A0A6I8MDA8_9FUSO|nr:Na+/H+ antiporter NhaC [Oceanivirga miroungae]VWL85080.1 Na(+)/H(+) antiporter NhaC [Oceanivirga miroungae]